jgi:hypothetical protein
VAQLPRRLAPHLRGLQAALALLLWPVADAAAIDLAGTWHVLVHHRDAKTANPEADRWEDRVWEFERKGARLVWTEYPIVTFDDESGRFERRAGTGQYARVLHAWAPSPAQLANIRAGIAVNDRGSQRKSLRRNGASWSSTARSSPTSVSVITYEELWSIEDPEGLPVFRQVERLGSESAEGAEGRTQWRTAEVLEDGALLVGSWDRDGTRVGTFEMRRAGPRKARPDPPPPEPPAPDAGGDPAPGPVPAR